MPHDDCGGRTPAPRNDSADSSSMLLAMLRVKKTMIVETRFGSNLGEHDPQRSLPLRDGGLDELLLAQREHLAADRSGHVRDVDEADDQDRDPQRVALQREEVDARERMLTSSPLPMSRARCRARSRAAAPGNAQITSMTRDDHGVDPAAAVAGEHPEDHAKNVVTSAAMTPM